MKNQITKILALLLLANVIGAQTISEKIYNEIELTIKNTTNIERNDNLISVNIKDLELLKNNFNKKAFIIYQNNEEIPSQLYNDGFECSLIFVSDFKPNESKVFSVKYLEEGELRRDYTSRTYAELAMKFDAVYKDKKFTSDHFENYNKVVVPKIHTDHDALFKYEGPGWESEKVGYRFYLDWRNATDIFGKKENQLILRKVGTNDVVAKDDSYHEMQEWGMDIFKVGNTLGIGSIGMMSNDKIVVVSKTDEVTCEISFNGPIISEVKTNYNGWLVNENKYDLVSKYSIVAGSRTTKANLYIFENADNITTGLAKHENTEFIKSNNEGDWQYIALYGKQTLANDNLGIVLFYKKSALIKQGEDEVNYFVSLKPDYRKVEYSFAAAWEKEYNGIKNKFEFEAYINQEITKLNNPLIIDIK
ncbi:MAG: DUF4861 domain-containing protein [Bacteroidetes bacterium]|nr:DUF4861 domain-containing protein [Bacteroidota bacterium]MBU1117071.1 DUF4861 domain-containing protein [Bacteroidota bacterium]MBU1799079.1 DUF4861 domain-containing protein [Bacteroidota bacterium]